MSDLQRTESRSSERQGESTRQDYDESTTDNYDNRSAQATMPADMEDRGATVRQDSQMVGGEKPHSGDGAEMIDGGRDDDRGGGSSNRSLVSDPETLRQRWESVQVGFVDDPRQAVGEAERLVTSAIEELEEGFRLQHQRLESRWSGGDEASTDDLRAAFQRYRDFFDRLLQV